MATGKYTYLSWIRKGMTTRIQDVDKLGKTRTENAERAVVEVKVHINSPSKNLSHKEKQFELLGPGDIKVKAIKQSDAFTIPENRQKNVEYNNFSYIQFYDEDFPWRFSPAKANTKGRLRPWPQLLALKDDEFTDDSVIQSNYKILTVSNGTPVPYHEESYLWAHVQIEKSLGNNKLSSVQEIIEQDPNSITSRILSPRKLEPGTKYTMFLIPAFERGRLAGLGASDEELEGVDVQEYALKEKVTTKEERFPIYHSWSFTTTTSGGDFEELAGRLKKVDSNDLVAGDKTIGSLKFSALEIGDQLGYTKNHLGKKGQMEMCGALLPDGKNQKSLLNVNQANTFTEELSDYLNDPLGTGDYEDDPIIAPPIYGGHHVQNNTLDSTTNNWLNEVNLDPGNRLVAGLGAEVFKEHQDAFMQEAWAQQGDIEEANRKINVATLFELTNSKLHNKYIKHTDDGRKIAMSSLLHGRIEYGSASVKRTLEESSIPTASLSKVFQQSIQNRSTLMQATEIKGITSATVISSIQSKTFQAPTSYNLNKGGLILSKSELKSSSAKAKRSTSALSKTSVTPNASYSIKRKEQLALKSAFTDLNVKLDIRKGTTATRSTVNITQIGNTITKALIPSTTILSKLNGIIKQSAGEMSAINKVMAYPVITNPLSQYLKGKHLDMFIPQLDLLENDSVTILAANQKYIESLMLGFNYEMARELIWRDYPTDQKGSYARIFWESIKNSTKSLTPAETAIDYGHINEIHLWKKGAGLSRLGQNPNPKNDVSNNIVVVFRGDLLRYYPNTLLYFQKAKKLSAASSKRTLSEGPNDIISPEFIEKIGSDIHLIGFKLSMNDAKGVNDGLGYFLVMQEPPGENKFGMDISSKNPEAQPSKWSDLAWDQFKTNTDYVKVNDFNFKNTSVNGVKWGENSNHMAHILNQKLFKYAVHAEKLI